MRIEDVRIIEDIGSSHVITYFCPVDLQLRKDEKSKTHKNLNSRADLINKKGLRDLTVDECLETTQIRLVVVLK